MWRNDNATVIADHDDGPRLYFDMAHPRALDALDAALRVLEDDGA